MKGGDRGHLHFGGVGGIFNGIRVFLIAAHDCRGHGKEKDGHADDRTNDSCDTVNRQAELADAKSRNPDAVAWLYIPGAEVDDPVMQAEDNGFYLNRDELREYSTWGCYYADCRNHLSGRDALDTNTVIYGHSANDCDPDGVRFTKL